MAPDGAYREVKNVIITGYAVVNRPLTDGTMKGQPSEVYLLHHHGVSPFTRVRSSVERCALSF
jgi:hypothetical protein